jgi:tetratricopeptide (TPR) repeat protein
MPKPIKKRVQKKRIPVKEEEIKGTFTRMVEFINERRKTFIIALVSLIAVIAIFMVGLSYNASLRKKAYAFEVQAYNYYYGIDIKEALTDKQRWQKALELYKKSVETKVTPVALFYLGNCYYNLGKYKEAISEYERFIKRFMNERELLPIVYQKLAGAYLNSGNREMAFNTLEKLATIENGVFKDTALILEARYYEGLGETEKANEKYRELVENFPDSVWFNEANSKVKIAEEAKEGESKSPSP